MADPVPQRADARRNRQRILEAARTGFAAEGLSVPLDEIARRAGVGPGTFYRHFPTKEALFEAVVHDRLQRLADEARALRDAEDAGGALLGFIDQLIEEAAPKRDLVDALAGTGSDVNAAVAATAADLRSQVGYLLARAQRSGAIRPDLRTADLMAIISGILHAIGTRSANQADPQRTVAVLRDGLRVVRP